jgi:PAS domain S-box-containing protein
MRQMERKEPKEKTTPPRAGDRITANGQAEPNQLNDQPTEPAHHAPPQGTKLDIEKKEALRQTARTFESVIRDSPLAIDVFDRDGNTMIWNPAAERLLGWTVAEAIGRPLASIPDEARRQIEIVLEVTLEGASFTGIETVLRRKDGEFIDISLSTAPFSDGRGRIEGAMAVLVDISERKRAQEVLQFLSRTSAELTTTLTVGTILDSLAHLALPLLGDFVAIDVLEDGIMRRATARHHDPAQNDLAERLQQFVPADYPHDGRGDGAPQRGPEILPEISDTWLVRRAQNAEHLRLMRRLAPRSIMVIPLSARNKPLGYITLAITRPGARYGLRDLELAQEVARRAATAIENAWLYEEARKAVRLRDDVLAIVSHDLRNPINTISMTAELLREQLPGAEELNLVEIISRSTERMERLIRDLLDVARIGAEGFTVRRDEEDPADIVREAVQLQQPLAQDESIRLRAEIPRPLPRIMVDRERLLQVFQNLLENALKFTPEGGEITIRAEPVSGAIRFTVRDTGPGIDPDELPHLFDRFWQATKTTKTGTGLGLAIVKGIVKAHGGEIHAESKPGAGTTIAFTIPTATAAQQASASRAA